MCRLSNHVRSDGIDPMAINGRFHGSSMCAPAGLRGLSGLDPLLRAFTFTAARGVAASSSTMGRSARTSHAVTDTWPRATYRGPEQDFRRMVEVGRGDGWGQRVELVQLPVCSGLRIASNDDLYLPRPFTGSVGD